MVVPVKQTAQERVGLKAPPRDKSRTMSYSLSPDRRDSRERGQKNCLQLGRITDRKTRRTKVNARDLAKLKTAQKKTDENLQKLSQIRVQPKAWSIRASK